MGQDNSNIGIFSSGSAHQSLAEEKAAKLGAGKFWNIIHLLNELNYLHIQEQQVCKPLDESFITTALWWYYLQRGVSAGVLCAVTFVVFRILHVMLGYVLVDSVNNMLLYFASGWYVFYLSKHLLPLITYHSGAATKAVGLVFDGGVGSIVMSAVMKSYVLFMLIWYQDRILRYLWNWNEKVAEWAYWTYLHVLGPGYVEICFMLSVMLGGAAAYINFVMIKKDLKEDKMHGRPYNRLSVDH